MPTKNDIMWDSITRDLDIPAYLRDLAQRNRGNGDCLRCNFTPGVTAYCSKCLAPRLRYDARPQVIEFSVDPRFPPREL